MQIRSILTIIFSVVLFSVLGLGFYISGSPETNGKINEDKQRVADLGRLQFQIEDSYRKNCKLPDILKQPSSGNDYYYNLIKFPVADYTYQPLGGAKYKLCANFHFDSEQYNSCSSYQNFCPHKAGLFCFEKEVGWLGDKCKKPNK
jgi:hypothetical protein